ncbi:HipA: protein predicted to be involced in cell division [Desulfosarcina variabilis str. Montpellier]|uniref:type II toxin-antitoxin system HipA family toxin n=1 Tax=Desulfosarcina variabilis TaxID=2300 RepID=UPI003AFA70F2
MNHIAVRLRMPDGSTLPCGEMVTSEPDSRGVMQGAFRYVSDYLNHPQAFALDPDRLPLSDEEFATQRPSGVHAVFEDALPDDWGRRLLIRKGNLKRGEQTVPRMLQVMGTDGLGALSFFPSKGPSQEQPYAQMPELDQLMEAAYRYDAGEIVAPSAMSLLFRAASSPGGARPKALIRDENGDQWVAKFPSSRDQLDMIAIEAGTMDLARACGLTVPDFFVEKIGRRSVLFVKRFDVVNGDGRRHMISAQTLLHAEGYYVLGYGDLFQAMRKITSQPSEDLPALFRQMVFNAAVGNTDDHLKNFTVLHDNSGFFLSPAYDLLPDTAQRREHVLFFQVDHVPPDRETLLRMAGRWRIREAGEIIDRVIDAVSAWQSVFITHGVTRKDIKRLDASISLCLGKLRP